MALIPQAIREAERLLWPAKPEEIMVALKRLDDFALAFNIPSEGLRAAMSAYTAALKHLPADLVNEAIDGAMASHKYGMRLPLPAELVAHVAPQMGERRRLLGRLEMMDRAPVAERETTPPSPEEIAKIDAIMAQWRRTRGPDPAMIEEDEHAVPPNSKDAFFVEPNVAIYEQAKAINKP